MPWQALTRRLFLHRTGLLGLGAALWLVGCGRDGGREKDAAQAGAAGATPTEPCTDLSGLTGDQIAVRESFAYVPVAEDPEYACDVCEFWEEPAPGAKCGGCKLFAGPVAPEGSCDSFSPA